MDIGVDERISSIENRFRSILKHLNWTEDNLLQKVVDKNIQNVNKISANSYDNAQEDPLWPESLPTEKSIVLNQEELRTLLTKPDAEVPQKFSDLQLNFNRAEKLKIYEYVVKSFPTTSNNAKTLFEHEKLFGEIVAKQKREKKRRHKYRTIRPTYIEELRNVVEMQMSALQQYLKPKIEEEERQKKKNIDRNTRKRRGSPMKSKNPTHHRHRSHTSKDRHKSSRYDNQQRYKK